MNGSNGLTDRSQLPALQHRLLTQRPVLEHHAYMAFAEQLLAMTLNIIVNTV
jgi:hypothetical protein